MKVTKAGTWSTADKRRFAVDLLPGHEPDVFHQVTVSRDIVQGEVHAVPSLPAAGNRYAAPSLQICGCNHDYSISGGYVPLYARVNRRFRR
jgi:hypothetical protein